MVERAYTQQKSHFYTGFFEGTGIRTILKVACVTLLLLALARGAFALFERVAYEIQGPLTADSPLYLAVGRGILNGLVPYLDLYENKPPGIFLLSSLSLWLTNGATLASIMNSIMIMAFPLLVMWGSWLFLRDTPSRHRLFALLLSALFGTLIALYMAERSGEFQVESFGAFFTMLYILTIADPRASLSNVRLMFASLFLLFAVGMKEPFLLTAAAAALLLHCHHPRMLWRTFVLPLCLAAFAGLILLALLGYAGSYFSIYLPEMLFRHIGVGSSPLSRAWEWTRVFRDLQNYQPLLGIIVILMMGTFLIRALLRRKLSALLLHALCMLVGVYFLVLAVGMGGQFYNHHFAFAVPGYVALFLVCLHEIEGKEIHWLHRTSIFVIALFMILATNNLPSADFAGRIHRTENDEAPAKRAASRIDAVLESCRMSSYLYLGSNGVDAYAYTSHSPLGPNFYQYDYLVNTDRPFFRTTFLENLQKANLIVFRGYAIGDLRDVTDSYIREAFTTDPWGCAQSIASTPGYTFYYRHRKDLPGSRSPVAEIAQN